MKIFQEVNYALDTNIDFVDMEIPVLKIAKHSLLSGTTIDHSVTIETLFLPFN